MSTNQSYYIRKVDDNTISLAYSLENARRGQYITIFGSADLSGITTHSLTPSNVGFSTIGAQKLLRKFVVPEYSETKNETIQGGVGLFVNGVEIYSYKSTDKVFYGPIQSVSVLNEGSDFDVINPLDFLFIKMDILVRVHLLLHMYLELFKKFLLILRIRLYKHSNSLY